MLLMLFMQKKTEKVPLIIILSLINLNLYWPSPNKRPTLNIFYQFPIYCFPSVHGQMPRELGHKRLLFERDSINNNFACCLPSSCSIVQFLRNHQLTNRKDVNCANYRVFFTIPLTGFVSSTNFHAKK